MGLLGLALGQSLPAASEPRDERVLFFRIGRADLLPYYGLKGPGISEHYLRAKKVVEETIAELDARVAWLGPEETAEREIALVVPPTVSPEAIRDLLSPRKFRVERLLVTGVKGEKDEDVPGLNAGTKDLGSVLEVEWDPSRKILFALHLRNANVEAIRRTAFGERGRIARDVLLLEMVSGDVGHEGTRLRTLLEGIRGVQDVRTEDGGRRARIEIEFRAIEELRVAPGSEDQARKMGWRGWCWRAPIEPILRGLREKGVVAREVLPPVGGPGR